MPSHRLPPKLKLLIRLTTVGLGALAAAAAVRMAPLVMKPKAATTEVFSLEKSAPREKTGAALMGELPLSAPSAGLVVETAATARKPPPPFDLTGLNLKGVFVNMFDKRKSIVIVSVKGGRDLILKRGDMAREGVMLDEIYPDHAVFKGINNDRTSLNLTDFVKEAMIMSAGAQPMTASIADMEDPMGAPIYDPTSPGPGLPGDVTGDGGLDRGPVKYMPIPTMPSSMQSAGMAAPIVSASGAEKDISLQMNAAQKMVEQGQ